MWSIFIVLPIVAAVCFIIGPSLYHFFWYICHGIQGFDEPPGLFLYWGGGINRLNSPEFTGPNAGTLGTRSDYQQMIAFLAVYQYIQDLKNGTPTGIASASTGINGTGTGGTTGTPSTSGAPPPINPTMTQRRIRLGENLAQKLAHKLRPKINNNKLTSKMRSQGRSDQDIMSAIAILNEYADSYADDDDDDDDDDDYGNGLGKKKGFRATIHKKDFITEDDVKASLNSGMGLNGLGWQTDYDSALLDDPVLQMLLQLTENASTRVCRQEIAILSWNTAKTCSSIVVLYGLSLCTLYFLVELAVDPRSIWFGGWTY